MCSLNIGLKSRDLSITCSAAQTLVLIFLDFKQLLARKMCTKVQPQPCDGGVLLKSHDSKALCGCIVSGTSTRGEVRYTRSGKSGILRALVGRLLRDKASSVADHFRWASVRTASSGCVEEKGRGIKFS